MPPRNHYAHRSLTWVVLALLLAVTWLCYLPGLHGGYLFDDFVNLPALGASGPVDNWQAFWRYITSGTADPTGRPLAMLSFLLDAHDWPADPAPFLRTNVLAHLINTALLFVLLRGLGRQLDGTASSHETTPSPVILSEAKDLLSEGVPAQKQSRSFAPPTTTGATDAAALLGAGLWALHPLLVSTTLYIVQREAMLPATFVLLGLLAWLHGRSQLAGAPRAGMAWMILGIGLGTALAVLSKANGALLPLLAWVLDATVLRGPTQDPVTERRLKRLRLLLLVVPSLLVVAYLLARLRHLGVDLASRPWTIGERLLTEPRVVLDYLRLLVVPRVLSTGLYNDAYVVSTSLLQPLTTLPAAIAVVGLVTAGFALRKRAPALSAALLFYFGGQLLESTTISLELYFEHRNYLPALLLGWPLARAICRWQVMPWARGAAAILLLAILGATTWQRAALWADQDQMALLWAAQNPASSRAQATAASFEIKADRADLAMARLAVPWKRNPADLQLALNYINAACTVRGVQPAEIDAVTVALRTATQGDQLLHRWLGRALDNAIAGNCPGLDLPVVERWLAAALANPRLAELPGRQQDLHSLVGRVALAHDKPDAALQAFNQALDAWPTPQAAATQAALLATNGAYAQALSQLDHYAAIRSRRKRATGWNMRRVHAWVLARQGYWPHELSALRRQIESDQRHANQAGPKQ